MPFIHNINPTLFNIGPLEIRYYGLVYVLGFLAIFLYFNYLVKKGKIKLTKEELYDFVFYNMLGVLIGSRLLHCFVWQPAYYLSQPWKVFFIWEGGMAFHGGLLGVALATYLFSRKPEIRDKVSFARLGDYIAIPGSFILAVGRIANFINGELPGRLTNVSWCIDYTKSMFINSPPEGCRHPQVLYAAAKRFLVFGTLLWLNKKKHKDGFIMWSMITLFGIGRVAIDFFRDDPVFLGLTTGQHLSLVMVIVGTYVLAKHYRKDLKKVFD
ncbi:prolipoprotein diacylglyceryl transferase [Candidatus Woesearchaeota archaeon]|nr:prolipoprotein diacylglyceryl transferase [Candidatus Woesearchaeota archaeon]